jgi:hypothetical protein
MAVTFRKDLQTLVNDLLAAGYTVHSVEKTPEARGKDIEISLTNGVVVNWDVQSKSIWAEGPRRTTEKTELHLRQIYEGDLLSAIRASNALAVLGALVLASAAVVVSSAEILGAKLRGPRASISKFMRGADQRPSSRGPRVRSVLRFLRRKRA